MSRRSVHQPWTVEEIRALGTRCDLVTAGQILGVGKNKIWALYHAGELPFPTLKLGRRVIVPTSTILDLLGLRQEDPRLLAENERLRGEVASWRSTAAIYADPALVDALTRPTEDDDEFVPAPPPIG